MVIPFLAWNAINSDYGSASTRGCLTAGCGAWQDPRCRSIDFNWQRTWGFPTRSQQSGCRIRPDFVCDFIRNVDDRCNMTRWPEALILYSTTEIRFNQLRSLFDRIQSDAQKKIRSLELIRENVAAIGLLQQCFRH